MSLQWGNFTDCYVILYEVSQGNILYFWLDVLRTWDKIQVKKWRNFSVSSGWSWSRGSGTVLTSALSTSSSKGKRIFSLRNFTNQNSETETVRQRTLSWQRALAEKKTNFSMNLTRTGRIARVSGQDLIGIIFSRCNWGMLSSRHSSW